VNHGPAESIGVKKGVFKGHCCLLGRAARLPLTVGTALLCAWLSAYLSASAASESPMGKQPGKRLLELCRAAEGEDRVDSAAQADARTCLAFIDGFIWGHAWASWREAKDMWFCLPQEFRAAQGAKDVVRYLSAHPDRLDEDSHLLVFLALTAAYPCKR
jgi:Rap1a immunity proteins